MIPSKRGGAPGGPERERGGDVGKEGEDKPGQGGQQTPEVEPGKEEGDMEKEGEGEGNRDELT